MRRNNPDTRMHEFLLRDSGTGESRVGDEDPAEERTWFNAGETGRAALLAVNRAVPAGAWFATITALSLAFIGTGVLFLPFFILSKVIRSRRREGFIRTRRIPWV